MWHLKIYHPIQQMLWNIYISHLWASVNITRKTKRSEIPYKLVSALKELKSITKMSTPDLLLLKHNCQP